jgi:hypothetical protein
MRLDTETNNNATEVVLFNELGKNEVFNIPNIYNLQSACR